MTQVDIAKHIQRIYPEMLQEDILAMMKVVFRGLRSAIAAGGSVNIPGVCVIRPKITRQEGKVWKNPYTLELTQLHDKVTIKMSVARGFEDLLTSRLLNNMTDEEDPTVDTDSSETGPTLEDPTLNVAFSDL
jgi:nucleoid DNA-binding protein